MAHIEAGGGGRRVNQELNLVPFIDLMSVLITFLLLTAVWTQVSMIQIGSSIYGKKSETQPPQVTPDTGVVLKIDIRQNGYVLTVASKSMTIPFKENDFDDEMLLQQLKIAKETYPTKTDAVVAMSDELPYELLIKSMDVLLTAGFPTISVATGGPN